MTKIESFFLNTFLIMSIVGTIPALAVNILLHPSNHVSIIAQSVALAANVIAFLIRKKVPMVSVIMLTGLVLAATAFAGFQPPHNITSYLVVIVLCGFIHSVMLKGTSLLVMHGICAVCTFLTFRSTLGDPDVRFTLTVNEVISGAITFSVLYIVLTYTTYVLKAGYDKMQRHLRRVNSELHEKNCEIEAQNEELVQTQDNLNELNRNLEGMVGERTMRIQHQNEVLIRYSYANAHQLRGPVARLMGLASIFKLDTNTDPEFIVEKMLDEANAIDIVVQQINSELDSGYLDDNTIVLRPES